jgi:hypothetical protein
MNIWVRTVAVKDPFRIPVEKNEGIDTIKNKIRAILSSKNLYIPAETKLIFQGRAITNEQDFQSVNDNDHVLFLYSLTAKPKVEAPPHTAVPAQPTTQQIQSMVQDIVSSFMPPPPQLTPAQRLQQEIKRAFPQAEQALNTMIDMGFPSNRANKALLLNSMNPELAMEWLFEHMDDPDIDAPISNAQMDYIMETLGQAIAKQKQNTMAQRVENARKNNKCTFTGTGREYAPQVWFQCYTCGLIDSEGCCDVCARICHAGHKLSEPVTSTGFFCDCGTSPSCKCNK